MCKLNPTIFVAFCIIMAALTGPAAEGKLITVDDDEPANFSIIQDAIDYASDGDEIEVRPGTYYQTVDFKGKKVRLYSSGGPEVTIIDGRHSYQDNFNDGNYYGWQIVDQGNYSTPSDWSAATGEMVQSSNIYTEPTSDQRYLGTYALCTQDLPWVDYEVTLSMKAEDDDWMGVMFRYVDPNNYYRFAWNGTDMGRRLVTMQNGSVMALLSVSSPQYVGGQWYQVRIVVKGDNLKVFVDDVLVFDVYDSSFSSGAIALYCWGNEGTYFDNIEVKLQALHVVQCVSGEDANTVLEGFTITGGNADGMGPDNHGGGMYNYQSNPTVMNCIFSDNTAGYGGGMLNDASRPIVTDCNFMDNTATSYGGGMENFNGSSAMVNNCTFSGNTATEYGGGMINNNSSPTLTNCIFWNNEAKWGGGMFNNASSPTVTDCNFTGNIAGRSGGGMYSENDSNSIVSNCIFSNNKANGNAPDLGGGGMYNLNNSNPTLTNCTFSNNTANNNGGGIRDSNSSPSVTNCAFSGNTATFDGGGMYNYLSNPTLVNCIFWNNTASYGGGMYNYGNSSPTLTNCTFSKNMCVNSGGGIINNSISSPTLMNCILWGNTPDQINDWDSPASTTTVSFSDVQGGWPGVLVIDSDPLFVDAAGGDLRLSSNASPCVDMGANFPGLPSTDLAGNPRIVDGDRNGTAIVDMGAYEYQSWLVHNITQDEWYETIQLAIDSAAKGDEIEVSPGTYNEAIDFIGKAIRLYSSGGPAVTTIDANGLNSSVVTCNSGEDANTILEGFTITGGSGTTVGGYKYGGGMYNDSSSPTVTNCNFSTNSVTGDGGGMFNKQWSSPTVTNCSFTGNSATYGGGINNYDNSAPTVTNCTFSDNSATDGGGVCNSTSSNPTMTNCTFSSNETTNLGGGMYNYSSSPTVTDCSFAGNSAASAAGGVCNSTSSNPKVTNCIFRANTSYYGGGINNYDHSAPTVTNCTFSGNSAVNGGGMCNSTSSNPTMTNCTFSSNESSNVGGGMYNYTSNPTVTNCILWGNTAPTGPQIHSGSPTVTYSDVQGGWGGAGNIDEDPCFVDVNNPDPNLWNLRLQPDSPCVDAGDTTAVPSGILVDVDGSPRGLDDPASPDTGISVLGVTVDMGAYELQPCPIPGDINCDGVVDFKDVAILCNNWLAGTEPEL